ncbi:uncharacterized protein SCDLUD_001367 [Saccharomycodes ludwigii]|uniref:uncharacterized protein n=1 Tax=Saccharomycodes ludwigii TaxID=36035 RepID=UPI001E8B21EE|nr:hypothetical protein SCDLUD_001367 [Saccharomycodes ludwigii]KAH3901603.1 hypothetical protein SCDLUD_001367 [Saccharomycodes ludwigii]
MYYLVIRIFSTFPISQSCKNMLYLYTELPMLKKEKKKKKNDLNILLDYIQTFFISYIYLFKGGKKIFLTLNIISSLFFSYFHCCTQDLELDLSHKSGLHWFK